MFAVVKDSKTGIDSFHFSCICSGYQLEEIEQTMQLPKAKEESMIYKPPLKEIKNPTTTGDEG